MAFSKTRSPAGGSTRNGWMWRALKILVIAPSSPLLLLFAATDMGMPIMAEPGHVTVSTMQWWSGFFLIAGLGALWVSILSGGSDRTPAWRRSAIVIGILTGIAGGTASIVLAGLSDPSFLIALSVPPLAIALVELARMLRRPG